MFLIGIVCLVVLVGLVFLFRGMGRMQRLAPPERMKHSDRDQQGPGPRATGPN
jgi:hypothetical protein